MTLSVRVLVDLDGVVADFEARLYQRCTEEGIVLVDYASRTQAYCYEEPGHEATREAIRAISDAPGFFGSLPELDGAVAALHGLVMRGHDVCLVSSPLMTGHCITEKLAWVGRHLGDNWPWERLILTRDKSRVRGDVMIDDWPTMRNAEDADWTRVVFDQPYNRDTPGPRLGGWGQYSLDGLVEFLVEAAW